MTIENLCTVLREKPVRIWTLDRERKELTPFRYLHTYRISATDGDSRGDSIQIVRQDIRYHPGSTDFVTWDELPFVPESLAYILEVSDTSFYEDIKDVRHDTKLGPIGSLYEYLAEKLRDQIPHAQRRRTEPEKIAQALRVSKRFTG